VTRARWIGLVGVALVVEAILVRRGLVADPLPHLAGTAVWTTSRAAGVTAFAALALDVMFGLCASTGILDRWIPRAASIDVHRWLSGVALALVATHALLLLGDPTLHFDALDVLVPGLAPYRPAAVAVGVLAFHVALVVHASFGWRKRIGVRAWRTLHVASFAVFGAAVAHGLLAGSDGDRVGIRAVYASAGAIVLALTATRLVQKRASSSVRARLAPIRQ